ncbi:MAG: hypothetical protein ABIN99_12080, partial [Nitrosospira sp.]
MRKVFAYDTELKTFFAICITTSGAKSFVLKKRIDGKVKWLMLGRSIPSSPSSKHEKKRKLLETRHS